MVVDFLAVRKNMNIYVPADGVSNFVEQATVVAHVAAGAEETRTEIMGNTAEVYLQSEGLISRPRHCP